MYFCVKSMANAGESNWINNSIYHLQGGYLTVSFNGIIQNQAQYVLIYSSESYFNFELFYT